MAGNADIARANSAAFSRRDLEAMLDLFAPDAVASDERPNGWGEYRGKDMVRSYYQGIFDQVAAVDERFEVVHDEDDVVIAACHLTVDLTDPPDAPPLTFDYALRLAFRDGLITSIQIHEDPRTAGAET